MRGEFFCLYSETCFFFLFLLLIENAFIDLLQASAFLHEVDRHVKCMLDPHHSGPSEIVVLKTLLDDSLSEFSLPFSISKLIIKAINIWLLCKWQSAEWQTVQHSSFLWTWWLLLNSEMFTIFSRMVGKSSKATDNFYLHVSNYLFFLWVRKWCALMCSTAVDSGDFGVWLTLQTEKKGGSCFYTKLTKWSKYPPLCARNINFFSINLAGHVLSHSFSSLFTKYN